MLCSKTISAKAQFELNRKARELICNLNLSEFSITNTKQKVKGQLKNFFIDKITKKAIYAKNLRKARQLAVNPKKVRPITWYGKDWNKILNQANKDFTSILEYYGMFHVKHRGFRKDISIRETLDMLEKYNYYFQIDLKSSFNQISRKRLRNYFVNIWNLDKQIAEKFAWLMAPTGRMFQGNPLSPLLFNLMTFDTISQLQKEFPKMEIVSYADDFTFAKFDQFKGEEICKILSIFESNDFEIEPEKIERCKMPKILGAVKNWKKGKNYQHQKFTTKKRIKRNMRLWKYLLINNINESNRYGKKNQFGFQRKIPIEEILNGYSAWYKHIHKTRKFPYLGKLKRKENLQNYIDKPCQMMLELL